MMGVASLAAIAIAQIVKNWDALAGGHLKTQVEELEELRQKASLTADEFERIARADAPKAKVNELRAGQTEAQDRQDAAVTKAIKEAGFRDVARGVLKAAPELLDGQVDAALAKEEVDKAQASMASARAFSENAGTIAEAWERVGAASRKQDAAREKMAEELAATGALAKLFPGGLAQLREIEEKDTGAFGPGAAQFRKGLKEAAKTPDDLEDEKAQEHYDEQIRANDDRLARLRVDADEKEAAEEKAAQELLDRQEQEYREKLAAWQEQGRQSQFDEFVDSKSKQMMEDRRRTAPVFDGPASLRDSIQSSIAQDNNPAKQTELLRAIETQLRQSHETLIAISNRTGGPARAG